MNLYLIEQKTNDDYDTYDSAVVIAKDESHAISIHPSKGTEWDGEASQWDDWTEKGNVTATKIGKTDETVAGVVLASYNAG